MAKGLTFFKEHLGSYRWDSPENIHDIQISPIPTLLDDGSTGYYLGDDWNTELDKKGATKRSIVREEILSYDIWESLPDRHPIKRGDKVAIKVQDGSLEILEYYNCIQDHPKEFSPELVPNLFDLITVQGDIEIWSQPIGGDGKYPYLDPNTGEPYQVIHNGFVWENTHTGSLNVWRPGVFGWTNIGPA